MGFRRSANARRLRLTFPGLGAHKAQDVKARLAQSDRASDFYDHSYRSSEGCEFDPRGGLLGNSFCSLNLIKSPWPSSNGESNFSPWPVPSSSCRLNSGVILRRSADRPHCRMEVNEEVCIGPWMGKTPFEKVPGCLLRPL